MPGRPVTDDVECELFYPIETNLAEHHKLITSAIEETSQLRYGRLMIFTPPGAAKSTYASVVFPSKYLGEKGGRRLILCSYGADLAKKMGRRTRSIIRQKRYERLFNCTLNPESQAADQFSLTNGSEYLSNGLLAGIAGNRADGAIIDDPFRGREDANSITIRDKTWDAYTNDLLTRLVPGGWLVLIQTRWHENDLAGRILPVDWDGDSGYFKCQDGMTWRVLCLQAKCETHSDPLGRQIGEYIWQEWFDAPHWAQFERIPYIWNSLFQQRPRPIEGTFFTEDMFLVDGRPVDWPISVDAIFVLIDTGMKTGKKRDGTAVTFFSVNRTGHPEYGPPLCILDWGLQQTDAALLIEWLPWVFVRAEELARLCGARGIGGGDGVLGVWIEDKNSGTVLIQQARNRKHKLESEGFDGGPPIHEIASRLAQMGKNERGMNASGFIVAGDVKITRHAYEKTVEYKGRTANHLLKQMTAFDPTEPDMVDDDSFDTVCYGVAMALGGPEGM